MSESLGLGDSDADARWIGVRRHQALFVIVGFGLVSYWVLRASSPIEVIVGVMLLAGALPSSDGLTVFEVVLDAARYVARSHWCEYIVRELGNDVVLWSSGEVALRGYELVHRGRLDLSGRDVTLAEGLAGLVDAASAAASAQHISQHVIRRDGDRSTLLTLPIDVPTPDGWRANNSLALEVLGAREKTSIRLFERFTYLRTGDSLVRIFRVRDFSSVPATRSLLEAALRSSTSLDVAVHVDVVAGSKAQRIASRAVHRVRSDEVTSSAAGFRRTARSKRGVERLAQREVHVASGRSLLRVAVFLLVSGNSLDDVQQRSTQAWRAAHDAGLRLERGRGRQFAWYRAQLPGGPGW